MATRTVSATRSVAARSVAARSVAAGRVVDTLFWSAVVASWNFEETSGNAIDRVAGMALTANAAPGTVAGIAGNARSLVRSSAQYFSVADNATLSMGDVAFAISVWFYHQTQTGSAGDYAIVNKYTSASQRGYKLGVAQSANTLIYQVSNDGSNASGSFTSITGPAPILNAWTHYLVGFDKTRGALVWYINGALYTEVSHTGGAFDNTVAFEVGRGGASGLTADGYVDALTVWKNYCPVGPEVALLYNAGVGWQMPL